MDNPRQSQLEHQFESVACLSILWFPLRRDEHRNCEIQPCHLYQPSLLRSQHTAGPFLPGSSHRLFPWRLSSPLPFLCAQQTSLLGGHHLDSRSTPGIAAVADLFAGILVCVVGEQVVFPSMHKLCVPSPALHKPVHTVISDLKRQKIRSRNSRSFSDP